MAGLYDWNASASLNTSVSGVNIAENAPRANMNDAIRAVMAAVKTKALETVSVKDFGAVGDGVADDTAAIQAAVDSNTALIVFPPGTYLHTNLNFDNDYQRFYGPGATLQRTSAAATITVSARGIHLNEMRFSGGSLSGNNLTITGPDVRLINCESRSTSGRALRAVTCGGGLIISGGVYQTTDNTVNGYDIELYDAGAGTLYCTLSGIITNQSFGGVLVDGNVGSSTFVGGQIGKLTIQNGGSLRVLGVRVVGNTVIDSSFVKLDDCDFAGDVTFGNSTAPNLSGISFGATNAVAATKTVTIGSEVQQSVFFLGQVQAGSANISIDATAAVNNDIWHNRISYTPTITAASGGFSLGNGVVGGGYSRNGRVVLFDFNFQAGSTTAFGTGEFRITTPFKTLATNHGAGTISDAGTRSYNAFVSAAAGNSYCTILPENGTGNAATATVPMTWANSDALAGSLTFVCTA